MAHNKQNSRSIERTSVNFTPSLARAAVSPAGIARSRLSKSWMTTRYKVHGKRVSEQTSEREAKKKRHFVENVVCASVRTNESQRIHFWCWASAKCCVQMRAHGAPTQPRANWMAHVWSLTAANCSVPTHLATQSARLISGLGNCPKLFGQIQIFSFVLKFNTLLACLQMNLKSVTYTKQCKVVDKPN